MDTEENKSGAPASESEEKPQADRADKADKADQADQADQADRLEEMLREAEEGDAEQEPGSEPRRPAKKQKKRKPSKIPGKALTIGMIACVVVIAVCVVKLVSTYAAYRQGTEEYDSLRGYTTEAGVAADSAEPGTASGSDSGKEDTAVNEGSTDMHTQEAPPIQVDWDSLKAINQDIVGWIYIGSLDLSYPVVQGEDDDYYLHRTFERKDNFSGSVFVEAQNSGTFTDPNTIVYGHNMKNGSMFGMLAHIQSDELYRDNPWFWILTPDGNYRYRMFSMRRAEVQDDTYTIFNGTDQRFLDWCDAMAQASAVPLEKPVFSLKSQVVTLSTCTTDSGHRFVVQGVAVR